MSLHAKAKAAEPYVTGTLKTTLSILNEIKGALPLPWLGTAIAAGIKVLEIAEVRRALLNIPPVLTPVTL